MQSDDSHDVHKRPTRMDTLMQIAHTTGQRSTCQRLSVGALVVREGRTLSSGYNGAPARLPHCKHPEWEEEGKEIFDPNLSPCETAVHAEINAIAFAAKYGQATEGAELIVTHSPCLKCAQLIINAGIVRVTYDLQFRSSLGVQLLFAADIPCIEYSPGT